ncbi:MAG: hypothetical protein EAX86_09550 [Candidatus Heimdallarchaeota archaeon]|nr:hypothetical protein [Candidatus Heimdallarchaeota archaeon]
MENTFKIALIGSSEVSKKFVAIYTYSKSSQDSFDTLGLDTDTMKIRFDNHNISLIFTRISAQARFSRTMASYFRGSKACIIFFEKKDRTSFNNISKRYEEFRKHIPEPAIPMVLVGITSDSEEVSTEEAQVLTEQLLNCSYFDCTLTNRNELDTVVKHLLRKYLNK